MAKFTIKAGAELDMLTAAEVDELLQRFVKKMGEGVKFRRVVESYPVINDQIVGEGFGPLPGYVWDLRYVFSAFGAATTPAAVEWYFNDPSAVNLISITTNSSTAVPQKFTKNTFIVHPGEFLLPRLSASADQGPATNISLALGVVEVPVFHEGQLLL